MSKVTVTVKPTSGNEKLTIELDTSNTILEFKDLINKQNNIPAAEQRLIYKGQILKDERTVESYGIGNEHVVHLVRRAETSSSPGQASSQSSSATAAAPGTPAAGAVPDPLGMGGLFGMPAGFGNNPQQLSQVMNDAMNSPMMQAAMNNPELLRTMLQSNPMVREVADRNPEVAQLLNNPQLLRESMQIFSNPSLLREHMRHADRALSNIEALPEGFNTLRRLYENVQEPLMAATASPEASTNPFAALLQPSNASTGSAQQTQPAAGGTGNSAALNTAPLPNPWAPAGGTATAQPGSVPAGLGAGLPGLSGGLPQLDPNQLMQMMQNPGFQSMAQSMMSSPGFTDAVINMNPQLRSMMDANPQFREVMSNPEMRRQMFDPANMQAMVQMQQALQQLQSNPLFAQFGGQAGGAGLGGMGGPMGFPGMGGMGDPSSLFAALSGGAPPAAPPPADPEAAYATQLQQLQDMGFFDRQANIRALQATGGNVHAAVDRLLSQM